VIIDTEVGQRGRRSKRGRTGAAVEMERYAREGAAGAREDLPIRKKLLRVLKKKRRKQGSLSSYLKLSLESFLDQRDGVGVGDAGNTSTTARSPAQPASLSSRAASWDSFLSSLSDCRWR